MFNVKLGKNKINNNKKCAQHFSPLCTINLFLKNNKNNISHKLVLIPSWAQRPRPSQTPPKLSLN